MVELVCDLLDSSYVVRVCRISLLNGQPWIARRLTSRLGLRKCNHLTGSVTSIIAGVRTKSPAGICRQRHRNLGETDARNIIPVDIGLRDQSRVGGTEQNR